MAQVKALIGNIKGQAGEKGKDGSENQIYSTTEQAIGTWIDGKPLYKTGKSGLGAISAETK